MGFFHPVALQYVSSIKEECTVSIIRATVIRETKFKLLRQVYVDE